MTIWEKLDRLLEFANVAGVARAAGINPVTRLHHLMRSRTAMPSIYAVKLAQVLKVDVTWLIDDAQVWPPIRTESAEPAHAA
jgi:hypothetical protein